MGQAIMIGLDIAKTVFEIHADQTFQGPLG